MVGFNFLRTMVSPYEIFGMTLDGRIALKGRPARHFAFCELGAVSPLPQPSVRRSLLDLKQLKLRDRTPNPNHGLKSVLEQVRTRYYRRNGWRICITPVFGNETRSITQDYERVYSLFYDFADLFCIDTTLKDGSGNRPLEALGTFTAVLDAILNLRRCYDEYKPLLVRLSPSSDPSRLEEMLMHCRMSGVEGVMVGIEGNTTADLDRTVRAVKHLHDHTLGRYPIIACIQTLEPGTVLRCLESGASMVQALSRNGYRSGRIEKKVAALSAGAAMISE